jgi:adenylate cyclase class IV
MWEGVRIHLDEVEGLGEFLEFEAPVEASGEAGARELVERLRAAFRIGAGDLVAGSYVDLVADEWVTDGPTHRDSAGAG